VYFTHHFAHDETLARAHSWLTRLGFEPHSIEIHHDGVPRITLSIPPERWGEVSFLINAVERTDPDGFPSFWVHPRRHRARSEAHPETAHDARRSRPAAIGWHPLD
jgi:hypothetical protein